jgi:hypothetical protein
MSEPLDAALLPPSVAQLATVIGWPGALKLVEAFGGRTLDLPKRMVLEPWPEIEQMIGGAAAQRMHQAYGGQPLYLPACKALASAERNRRMRDEVRDLERKMSSRRAVALTARTWRLTERTVWRALSHNTATTTAAPTVGMLYQLPLL